MLGKKMYRSLTFLLGSLLAVFHVDWEVRLTAGRSYRAISARSLTLPDHRSPSEVQIINAGTETLVRKVPTSSEAPSSRLYCRLAPTRLVNKSGFSEAKAEGIEVRVTETTRVTITLKPVPSLKKSKSLPTFTNVETTNPTTGQTLGTQTIRELPLARRIITNS